VRKPHSHAPSQVRRHRDGSVWPKRRMWQDRVACDKRFTPGAKSFLGLIASRSDDAGKPAWGAQARIGAALGRSERSVRRYVAEAEELGYLKVYRAKPERGPQGRWHRKKTNVYYLCLPKAGDDRPAPRRRQRAAYCVVSSHSEARREQALLQARKAEWRGPDDEGAQRVGAELVGLAGVPSHLQDSDDPLTPLSGEAQPAAPPPECSTSPKSPWSSHLAAARAALPQHKHSPLGGLPSGR
jgi:DNA-binding Lrp family transcriptional regulator